MMKSQIPGLSHKRRPSGTAPVLRPLQQSNLQNNTNGISSANSNSTSSIDAKAPSDADSGNTQVSENVSSVSLANLKKKAIQLIDKRLTAVQSAVKDKVKESIGEAKSTNQIIGIINKQLFKDAKEKDIAAFNQELGATISNLNEDNNAWANKYKILEKKSEASASEVATLTTENNNLKKDLAGQQAATQLRETEVKQTFDKLTFDIEKEKLATQAQKQLANEARQQLAETEKTLNEQLSTIRKQLADQMELNGKLIAQNASQAQADKEKIDALGNVNKALKETIKGYEEIQESQRKLKETQQQEERRRAAQAASLGDRSVLENPTVRTAMKRASMGPVVSSFRFTSDALSNGAAKERKPDPRLNDTRVQLNDTISSKHNRSMSVPDLNKSTLNVSGTFSNVTEMQKKDYYLKRLSLQCCNAIAIMTNAINESKQLLDNGAMEQLSSRLVLKYCKELCTRPQKITGKIFSDLFEEPEFKMLKETYDSNTISQLCAQKADECFPVQPLQLATVLKQAYKYNFLPGGKAYLEEFTTFYNELKASSAGQSNAAAPAATPSLAV